MNCEQAETLLAAYVFGEAQAHPLDELREHLDVCGTCSARLRDMQAAAGLLDEALGAAEAPALNEERQARLARLKWPKKRDWSRLWQRRVLFSSSWSRRALSAAAGLALVLLLADLLMPALTRARHGAGKVESIYHANLAYDTSHSMAERRSRERSGLAKSPTVAGVVLISDGVADREDHAQSNWGDVIVRNTADLPPATERPPGGKDFGAGKPSGGEGSSRGVSIDEPKDRIILEVQPFVAADRRHVTLETLPALESARTDKLPPSKEAPEDVAKALEGLIKEQLKARTWSETDEDRSDVSGLALRVRSGEGTVGKLIGAEPAQKAPDALRVYYHAYYYNAFGKAGEGAETERLEAASTRKATRKEAIPYSLPQTLYPADWDEKRKTVLGEKYAVAEPAEGKAIGKGQRKGKGRKQAGERAAQRAAQAAQLAAQAAQRAAEQHAKPAQERAAQAAKLAAQDAQRAEELHAKPAREDQKILRVVVNPFVMTKDDNQSTFALETDTGSYTLTRSYIRRGYLPPAHLVRVEEFVNAFDYNYSGNVRNAFSIETACARSPFRPNLYELKIGVKAKRAGRDGRRSNNFVLCFDTSSSMGTPGRLPLAQQAANMLVDGLHANDRVSIVTYGTNARLVLDATPIKGNRKRIKAVIDSVQAGGSTNMAHGLGVSYQQMQKTFRSGDNNTVLHISDGIANVGANDAKEILENVRNDRGQGITLHTVGVGTGQYNDQMMEQLADNGDGKYIFIDTVEEARRVFVDEFATLQVVAKDAKIQVEFDPNAVRRYRLLGYENRDIADRDFRNDAVDAGEIGSGQSATALYELELLKEKGPIGVVRVRYRDVETGRVEEIASRIQAEELVRPPAKTPPRFRLAACAAQFAEILRVSEYAKNGTLKEVEMVLSEVCAELPLDNRAAELLQLVRNAKGLPRGK